MHVMLLQSQHSLQPFLDRLTSRSALSGPEREAILNLTTRVTQVRANRDFVHMGERVDHATFIVDGLVGRFDQNSKGERQITALHIGADMPDLLSVVQPTATSALCALSTTTILLVPHFALREAAAAHPAIAMAFWRDCTVDAMILAQWVVNLGRRDARTRIAHLFCEMAVRYGAVRQEGPVVFQLAMTQTQLADATGLTSVHVNRTLQALADDGVVFQGKTVRILNWEQMVELADVDPNYLQTDMKPWQPIRITEQVS
jgi:CRP-like cAMP-binding protein